MPCGILIAQMHFDECARVRLRQQDAFDRPFIRRDAQEVQRLLAELEIGTQHFRVSMAGANSIVEFGADVSKGKQEAILTRLHREGVTIEVVPVSPRE
jgi:hypothetical protein